MMNMQIMVMVWSASLRNPRPSPWPLAWRRRRRLMAHTSQLIGSEAG